MRISNFPDLAFSEIDEELSMKDSIVSFSIFNYKRDLNFKYLKDNAALFPGISRLRTAENLEYVRTLIFKEI